MEHKSSPLEDASFLLFVLPIVISVGYAIYAAIASSAFSVETYLAVTSNHIVFLLAVSMVCVGTLLELYYGPLEARKRMLQANAKRLQGLAIITLILSLGAALVASGGAPLPIYFGTFLSGRYAILFSALVVLLSFLSEVPLRTQGIARSTVLNAIAVVSLLLAPIVYFAGSGGLIAFEVRASGAVALLIAGLVTIMRANKGLFAKKGI